jgi:hypothetical protein
MPESPFGAADRSSRLAASSNSHVVCQRQKSHFFLPMGYGSDPIVAATYAVLRVIFCIHSHHFCLNPNEDPASHPRHE